MSNLAPLAFAVGSLQLLAVASPGPDFAIVTQSSLTNSRRHGMFTVLGCTTGAAVHILYSLLGISLLIQSNPVAYSVLRYLGAAYLLYLGWNCVVAYRNSRIDARNASARNLFKALDARAKTYGAAFAKGFFTNLLNPKAVLYFLCLFSQVIVPTTPVATKLILAAEMLLVSLAWFAGLSYFMSSDRVKNKILRNEHRINLVVGCLMIFFGIKVAIF